VDGSVIHGDGRGKALGIPTANLAFWQERVMPASGVYATWAWIEGIRHPSVSNLGLRPTFDNNAVVPQLEAHLLDFDEDLYGRTVRLEFVSRLRPEVRFESVNALIEQIQRDKHKASEVLENAK
ncbi:MAG: riboflavin kinase, partial [Bellilinea sp.]